MHLSPEARHHDVRNVGLLLLGALAVRAAAFGFTQNFYGDAVVRTELGLRWASHPHWPTSFDDGVYQFGPLHIVLLGLVSKLWNAREDFGRALSLVCGVLTVVPVYALTRRLASGSASFAAGVVFVLWSLHIQFSTTAASEALSLLLTFGALYFFSRALQSQGAASWVSFVVLMNLAAATRYDVWLWVPALLLVQALAAPTLSDAFRRSLLIGLGLSVFPAVWCYGNYLAKGDWFFPLHYIEQYHRDWFPSQQALWGERDYRLQNLFFWPGVAVTTLGPLATLLALAGMARQGFTHRDGRWLLFLVVGGTAYFTVRSAWLGNFVPLSRFAVKEVALLVPFVAVGWDLLGALRAQGFAQAVRWVTMLTTLVLPLGLAVFTYQREGKWETSLRPISPVTTQPVELMKVANFLKHQVAAKGESVVLDTDRQQYRDVSLAFFSGLDEAHLARYRWDTFEESLKLTAPKYVVLIDGGELLQKGRVRPQGDRLRLDAWEFEPLPTFVAPFAVYVRTEPWQ
ncbi:MAG: glycosyltransferase family 39 protein [Myxococcaceae bacterium]|nr:glycosyltransferase family 39 protein [Myxococcaceae bacterium]